MAITVGELIALPELQLTLLAGKGGTERTVEWAHTSDLPNPWRWVGARQALLTNGGAIPTAADDQIAWARSLAEREVSGVGIGAEMGGSDLTDELLEVCDDLDLPLFSIPYPLPFVAVAQAVAESATLAQTHRLRIISRLYDFMSRDQTESLTGAEAVSTVADIIGHEIAIIDDHCWDSWIASEALPEWVPQLVEQRGRSKRINVPTVWESPSAEVAHLVPLGTLPGALAVFRRSHTSSSDQSTLLHAASVLGTALSRRELQAMHVNRVHSEYLSRILIDQNRFGFESSGWMHQLGYSGQVEAVTLLGPPSRRESTVSRLQRHGVRLEVTLQNERHLLVVQHNDLATTLEHCLEPQVRAGIGLAVDTGVVHESLKQSLWAVKTAPADASASIVHYDPATPWMGFHDPQAGEDFVNRILGPLLDDTPSHAMLIETLDVYLKENRSPQKAAQHLVVHRQTVIQRMKKVEAALSVDLADTAVIAQLWVAMTVYRALGDSRASGQFHRSRR
ncbi:PucR family transcriptional regulator ligand-binding domain-containing protein [Brevibacterium sp. 'Marine']|uniref:PucR family transcriptional regulator n=1 Tax=Brevibacterium sp. 'Marine' TaxID=2725563 RepID=UPI00145E316E|nr:PucR family transcriptional regulator ligand-binding domain-containing protein [Brevibacterium sp. 'Marine']